ncbi:MAG: transglycosylase SLT domain-containing protein, partial [Herminiimonas sp.]|nr:transglycosylase SLT domain-containing protein [Herminiimonas sp.]
GGSGGTNFDALAAQVPPGQSFSKSELLDRIRQALIAAGLDPSIIDRLLPVIEQWLDDPASSTGSLDTTPPVDAVGNSPQASDNPYQYGATTDWPIPSQTPAALKVATGPTGTDSPGTGKATGANRLSAEALAANPELVPYADDIAEASRQTGMDPNMIGAMVHAESRGNPGTSTTNGDGSNDVGLMQISQGRLGKDNLSADNQATIMAENGKSFDQLDVSNPHDNIIAGAWHLKHFLDQSGGNIDQALGSYVGRDPLYIRNVHTFWSELDQGTRMTDDAGTPI